VQPFERLIERFKVRLGGTEVVKALAYRLLQRLSGGRLIGL
jgi:hypothetical protein